MYLPILTYHRILHEAPTRSADPNRIAVSAAQFRTHLAWIKRLGYHTVGLNDYGRRLQEGRSHGGRAVALTFDDGYEEVLTLALPILQDFGFTATVFAVPGQLGGCNVWDGGQARLLAADQIRLLRHSGVTFGAHTCSHVHLPGVPLALARQEIADSKKRLEDVLGERVSTFAYPYGESSPAIETCVREAGFEAAFATDRASRDHDLNPYRIRRVVVFPRTTSLELLAKAQPWYPAYQDWKRRDPK